MRPVASQPELLPLSPEGERQAYTELEAQGEFTAERFAAQRPVEYQIAVRLLAERVGVIRIGKLLRASPNTIMKVRDRERVSIDIVKGELATMAHQGAALAAEGITELLGEILGDDERRSEMTMKDVRDLAVIFGIQVQNGQLLAGEATSRVETKDLVQPKHEDWNAYVAGLKAAGTSLGGESGGQKGAVPVPGAPGGEPLEVAKADVQSEGKQTQGADNQQS